MLYRPRIAAWVLLAAACASGAAQKADKAPRTLRTIAMAREAHDLPLEVAARHYPVHLHAVVTYYDPYIDKRHGAIFVHDASGSIFIAVPPLPILPLLAGTVVDVVGVTGVGDYAPVVAEARISVVGQSHVPRTAQPATLTQLHSGAMDGQWVEVEGRVHSVRYQPMNVNLELATDEGEVTATTVREPLAQYDTLVDSLVRVHANAAPVFNQKRQLVGTHLFFPTLKEMTVVQRAPADPFSSPLVPISRLLQFNVGVGPPQRVHVRGTVTLQWPDRMLCIQQGSDGLCLQTPQGEKVEIGRLVDAIGFPAMREFKPTLDDATFRIAAGDGATQATPMLPKAVSAESATRGDFDREFVSVEGQLVGQAVLTDQATLILRSGNILFAALLPRQSSDPPILPWKEGSILRVSGVCGVVVDSKTTTEGVGIVQPVSANVLLRDAGDVIVLHAPSWWTPEHALTLLAGFAPVVMVFVTWVVVLRRQVEEQTRAIRLSEERLRHVSQHDSLTGLPNRALLLDRTQMALKRIKRFEGFVGLLMVDLDGFKEVNDTLGHIEGDRVLCEAANRIRGAVRQTDTVARLGGDEFVVLLPDLHFASEAETIAAKIVSVLAVPVDVGSAAVKVSGSVGVCTSSDPETPMEKLFQSADTAMYQAKRLGKNRYWVIRQHAQEREPAPASS